MKCSKCGASYELSRDLTLKKLTFTCYNYDKLCLGCVNKLENKDFFVFNNKPDASLLEKIVKEGKVLVSRFNTEFDFNQLYNEIAMALDSKSSALVYWSTWVIPMHQIEFEQWFLAKFNEQQKVYKEN